MYSSSLKNSDDLFESSTARPVSYFFSYTLLQLSTPSSFISLFYLLIRNSSLKKQPFITAHFRSSLHVKTSPAFSQSVSEEFVEPLQEIYSESWQYKLVLN